MEFKMTNQIGHINTLTKDKINFIFPDGNRKLMIVIDNIEDSDRLLSWISNFTQKTKIKWMILFDESDLSDQFLARVNEKFHDADKLGAEKIFCYRTNNLMTQLKIAAANKATHIICTKSIKKRILFPILLKKVAKPISIQNGEIDIFCLYADNDLKFNKILAGSNN
jgi:K+-sensing histidine kinase KdpD